MPNHAQIAKIHAAAREVGWDGDQLYELVQQVSGGRSVRALDTRQTKEVIDALVRAGARPGKRGRKPSGRRTAANEVLLITPDQRTLIGDLRAKLGGLWLGDRYLEGACVKRIGKPRPTSAGDAARVIEMLKHRLAYEAKRAR